MVMIAAVPLLRIGFGLVAGASISASANNTEGPTSHLPFAGIHLDVSFFALVIFGVMTCLAMLSQFVAFLKNMTLHGKQLDTPRNNDRRIGFLLWLSRGEYWMVQKKRFLHFYIVGAISLMMVRLQAIDPWLSSRTLAQGLLMLHIIRRLYECLYVHQWRSSSRMHFSAYVLGLVYYALLPFLFCRLHVHEYEESLNDNPRLNTARELVTVILRPSSFHLCIFAQYQQGRHHLILANLRCNELSKAKTPGGSSMYGLPQGGWFEFVACPHYLAEILFYIGLAGLLGDKVRGTVIVLWVTASLTANALEAQRWYQRSIPGYTKLKRHAIFPGIL